MAQQRLLRLLRVGNQRPTSGMGLGCVGTRRRASAEKKRQPASKNRAPSRRPTAAFTALLSQHRTLVGVPFALHTEPHAKRSEIKSHKVQIQNQLHNAIFRQKEFTLRNWGFRAPPSGDVRLAEPRRCAWGRDPDIFDPARFLPGRSKTIERYTYLPFGVGPRIRIGAALAIQEATVVLATLMRRLCSSWSLDNPFGRSSTSQ
jgi:hypothetical protein